MKMYKFAIAALILSTGLLWSCSDDDTAPSVVQKSITIQNVLDSKPLVESGTFQNTGEPPVYMPGESFSIQFSAGLGQAFTFVTMYGWSNDLFFAPENPGIALYGDNGNPIEGDVSAQIKLWDNGTRVNQAPGQDVTHPGEAETSPQPIAEITGTDSQNHSYAAASDLMKVTLKYEGASVFTITIANTSGDTNNETPFSPGVWAVSYIAGGDLLDEAPLYTSGEVAANGITNIAEAGDNSVLGTYIEGRTGIFTPLSPILVVQYNGIDNPLYETGQSDAGNGLKELAQTGDASKLASYLEELDGVEAVYVLAAETSTVLLPMIGDQQGSTVTQSYNAHSDDKIAIATMYGLSNDWFFASEGDIDATEAADVSAQIGLYDNGTAVDQFPGAGISQAALGGTPQEEDQLIMEVPNPNAFTTLPDVNMMIKVTIQ